VSWRSMLCAVATSRNTWAYWLITLAFQNCAIAVWVEFRAVLPGRAHRPDLAEVGGVLRARQ
jgi:hypothetical protein